MDYPFIDLIRKFLGIYEPLETTIYVPIESVDPTTGAVYISGYESYQVAIEGLAGINVEYIVQIIMFLFMLWTIHKFILFAVIGASGNKKNKQTVKL